MMTASRRILFVSNGHGEIAISSCIAAEVHALEAAVTEHLPLVGGKEPAARGELVTVGPHRDLPSGGLVAMGNVTALARDIAAGFLSLWSAQRRFLKTARGRYDVVVAVGDVYCLWMALVARGPTIFVGTAKSVYLAPYGRFECAVLRRARRVFLRDSATARDARRKGVAAETAGNVIADLAISREKFPWRGSTRVVVLPGSRETAYANAARLGLVLRGVAARRDIEVAVSIAPGIDQEAMLQALGFAATPWKGALGALFADATIALGQAGTANEAAAAAGVPVVALADTGRKEDWYRMRQRRLLDGAIAIIPSDSDEAAAELGALLDDAARRTEMARIGRERMGESGAAATIARAVLEVAAAA
jgi:hypothetical protein